jgi:superoxide reductase
MVWKYGPDSPILQEEERMERRDFIKAAAVAAVMVASKGQTSFAAEEEFLRLKDKANPSALEQKHVPGISAPDTVKAGDWFDVKVKVGYMAEHPSTLRHWITYIHLRVDGKDVASVEYPMGGMLSPETVFRIRLDKPTVIEAVENCNIHGTWISEPVHVKVS